MKKTIAELISPSFDHYRSIGELAVTLSFLLTHADKYRDKGRWGDSGPWEILVGYRACTNCLYYHDCWHSGRLEQGFHTKAPPISSWRDVHDGLFDCILESLCAESPAICTWRGKHSVGLQTMVKVPMAYQHQEQEQKAWEGFLSLHRFELGVRSLNPCHKRINILVAPQLCVGKQGVSISCAVTDKYELRTSPVCYSNWEVSSLLYRWRNPRWNPRGETFAAFVTRAVHAFKSINHEVKYTG